MSDFLIKIRELTEARVSGAKATRPLSEPMPRSPCDFASKLSSGIGPRVIAEVKRASPSRGAIALELDPVSVAQEYAAEGAAVISVLTEPMYFGGSLETLARIRKALPGATLLMKDFIIDRHQLLQAREAGADAVLLMVSLLSAAEFTELFRQARELGLATLVEVHDEAELAFALAAGARVIGINNRDLRSLTVSLEVSRRLAAMKPDGVVFVSESGIESRTEIDELSALGFDGFLIGSALMATGKPGPALRALLQPPLEVKICGITRVEDARLAAQLGATMIGLIFVDQSPRRIDFATAATIVRALPGGVLAVGVFVSEQRVLEAVRTVGLGGVQFHEFEPSAELVLQLKEMGVMTVRAFGVDENLSSAEIESSACDIVLLDSPRTGARTPVDGEVVRALGLKRRFLLAGGLAPGNVGSYLRSARPSGVDLASGVEVSPGVKSEAKLRDLFSEIERSRA